MQNEEEINPFTFVKAFTTKKIDIFKHRPDLENLYVPFIANRAMSYHKDSILFANEMNYYADYLDNKLQFDFYLNTLDRKPRYSKWLKKEIHGDIEAIIEYYDVSLDKAEEIHRVLDDDQLRIIKSKLDRGGNDE